VYFDVNNDIAGFHFSKAPRNEQDFMFGATENEQLTKEAVDMQVSDVTTMIVGMRTTMDCISSPVTKSVQFIYISKDKDVCESLVPLPSSESIRYDEEEVLYCDQGYLEKLE